VASHHVAHDGALLRVRHEGGSRPPHEADGEPRQEGAAERCDPGHGAGPQDEASTADKQREHHRVNVSHLFLLDNYDVKMTARRRGRTLRHG